MTPTHFFAGTDIVVIGTNPEMADMVNPRGSIFGSAAFVYADSARGDRRRMHVVTLRSDAEAMAQAEAVAQALNARLAAGKLPLGFDRWEGARPAYGSDAYSGADEVALERREAEDEARGW